MKGNLQTIRQALIACGYQAGVTVDQTQMESAAWEQTKDFLCQIMEMKFFGTHSMLETFILQ